MSGVRERYPYKEDIVWNPGKWDNIQRGIQCLRELAVWEEIYYHPTNARLPEDPDDIWCG